MMSEEDNHIVLDNGSHMIKAGISGAPLPTVRFPSIVGKPKAGSELPTDVDYIGDEAQKQMNELDLTHPIKGGIV